MHVTTDGIVVRQTAMQENSRLLTILTKKHGLISAYQNGVKSLKGKGMSNVDLLCYSRFVLFHSKEKYVVDTADSLHVFFKIRSDLEKLSLASYFAELCAELAPRREQAHEFLRLMLNTLYLLEEDKRPLLFLKAVFELSALSLAGYMPNLVGCRVCGSYHREQMYFSVRDGELICSVCLQNHAPDLRPVSASVLHAMRHILFADREKLFSFALPEDPLHQLSELTEAFLIYQTGRKLKTLDFLKTVLDA